MENPSNRFGNLLQTMQDNRWRITLINLGTFAMIVIGILLATVLQTPVASEWKELLLLMLGAFIGNYNKTAEIKIMFLRNRLQAVSPLWSSDHQ